MKKVLIFSIFLALAFTACLKKTPFSDSLNANGTYATFPLGGIANFGADAITGVDTVTDTVEVYNTSNKPSSSAITVALIADFPKVAAYYAIDTSIQYLSMPTTACKFPASVTIPAGARTAKIPVTFYLNSLDPTKSYMLPLSIGSATGLSLSGNYNTHYFHVIGNAIAGAYTWHYQRYNNGVGPSAGPPSTNTTSSVVFSPVNPTNIEVKTGYPATQVRYELTFNLVNGKPTNFAVAFNAADVKTYWSAYTIISGPTIVQADPVKGVYEFTYTIFNGSANRFIDDTYTHQ